MSRLTNKDFPKELLNPEYASLKFRAEIYTPILQSRYRLLKLPRSSVAATCYSDEELQEIANKSGRDVIIVSKDRPNRVVKPQCAEKEK